MTEKNNKKAEKERRKALKKAERESVKTPAVKRTSIGGQAVLEGVMMKGRRSLATAVRTQTGEITVESKYTKSVKDRSVFARLPFVRGVVNLFTQLFEGTGILLRSAEVYGDFAEPSKTEEKIAKKFKINPMNLVMGFSVALGVLLAVLLFVFLPNLLTGLIFDIPALEDAHPALQSLCEGVIMLLVFVLYILSVSLMKDIRRVFMYHGAEHKVINCYEHGLELNVENARKASRQHSRCGTTFMFFVIAISILVFALVNWLLGELGWTTDSNAVNAFIKLGVKLLFLPVIAGISYELLKLLAKSDCLFVRILRAPGMALQLLTTKEPTDDMLEVSLTAFKTVLAMDENPELPERKFEIKIPYESAVKNLKEMLPDADESDIDWILVEVSGKPRSQLNRALILEKEQFLAACSIAEKMKKGAPLQYALGYTEFYGLRFELSPDVLIPRPETETLVEKAVEKINAAFEKTTSDGDNDKANEDETAAAERKSRKTVEVLDLCTGSGAVGVSIKCLCGAKARVTASDISEAALNMARANALNNGAEIEFAKGDLFEPLKGRAFDFILVNPPYIPTNDLKSLDKKVRAFEPALALDGGADGLDFYRRIEKDLSGALKPGGALMAEFGMGQAEAIKNIFKDYNTEIIKDIEGADRIVLAEVK